MSVQRIRRDFFCTSLPQLIVRQLATRREPGGPLRASTPPFPSAPSWSSPPWHWSPAAPSPPCALWLHPSRVRLMVSHTTRRITFSPRDRSMVAHREPGLPTMLECLARTVVGACARLCVPVHDTKFSFSSLLALGSPRTHPGVAAHLTQRQTKCNDGIYRPALLLLITTSRKQACS